MKEKKVNLDDDYIKFIRYGQYVVQKSGIGILAYISNNSFLDGITHREMRKQLLAVFDKIYVINLHGNSKRKEVAENGGKDENVFDIQQGVSINICVLSSKSKNGKILSYDLYGTREHKYDFLRTHDIDDIGFEELNPTSPNYYFIPKDFSNAEKYAQGYAIDELMPLGSSGIQTKNDSLAIQYEEADVASIQRDFQQESRAFLVEKYGLEDSAGWKIDKAIQDIKENHSSIEKILYRPYDWRYILYTNNSCGFLGRPREKVSRHFVEHENYGLLVRRNTPPVDFTHVYVCDSLISEGVLGIDPNGREYVFPLYLHSSDERLIGKQPNLDKDIVRRICLSIGVQSVEPPDVFSYTYAVLHSEKYRKEYAEFLKINYPRIPYPQDKEAFFRLVVYGKKLIDLHLLRFDIRLCESSFVGREHPIAENPRFAQNRVYINKTDYFCNISEEYWNKMVGGYAPLQKWLKLRKGKVLTKADIETYCKMAYSLMATDEIMKEIDQIIDF